MRCILFPKTKICISSATRPQANEVLLKIKDDFCKNYTWGSSNLCAEISNISIGQNNAVISFKNGSWIKVVTASDSGRGSRANILICDEFRMVDLDIINTVLRKFLTAPRTPNYLNKPEYAHLVERNKEIYMSSAWYQSHWSYAKAQAYFVNMMDTAKKYFICSLPYQISIKEGLLSRSQIEDEFSEADFDPVKFSMEMEALFFGDTDGSFFKFEDLVKRRKLKKAYPSLELSVTKNIKVPDLVTNEKRILSADIALLSSKKNKNDAASLMINSCIPSNNNRYIGNFFFMENHEGMTTDELGLRIMRLFYHYKCTDLALDVKGVGVGIFDFIIKDQYDPETGETYGALTLHKDYTDAKYQVYTERCKVKNALKVIHPIFGSPSFNTECCTLLRSGIQEGRLNLLISEFEAEEVLKTEIKGYSKANIVEQATYKAPYVQTTMAINELIYLDHEVKGTNIKLMEKSGARKDRYSSMAYNYYVQVILERKLRPQKNTEQNILNQLQFRQATKHRFF